MDLNAVYQPSASAAGRLREIRLRNIEWSVFFALDGRKSWSVLAQSLEISGAEIEQIAGALIRLQLVDECAIALEDYLRNRGKSPERDAATTLEEFLQGKVLEPALPSMAVAEAVPTKTTVMPAVSPAAVSATATSVQPTVIYARIQTPSMPIMDEPEHAEADDTSEPGEPAIKQANDAEEIEDVEIEVPQPVQSEGEESAEEPAMMPSLDEAEEEQMGNPVADEYSEPLPDAPGLADFDLPPIPDITDLPPIPDLEPLPEEAPPAAPPEPPARRLRLSRIINLVVQQAQDPTEGQILMYRIFLRVPSELMRRNGIKSLSLVDESTETDDELLIDAISAAYSRCTGNPMPDEVFVS